MENESGKISLHGFEEHILKQTGAKRSEVLQGPSFGVDVSMVELPGDMVLASTSDPLSLIPVMGMKDSAWLSVCLLINDMATTGAAPQYFQPVLNLSTSLSEQDFKAYWAHIHEYCQTYGIAITGGHTGFIEGQHSTIAGGGTMMAVLPKERCLLSTGAKVGDVLFVTKTPGLMAAAVLSKCFPNTIREKLGTHHAHIAQDLLKLTCVLPEAINAASLNVVTKKVTAMHDATEGGVLGAIYELCAASGCGAEINLDAIRHNDTVQAVAQLFELHPNEIIGAGSMVITVEPSAEKDLRQQLSNAGIPFSVLGTCTKNAKEVWLKSSSERKLYTYTGKDPYWEAFFKAWNAGWK